MNASDPNGTVLSAATESAGTPRAEERQWTMCAHLSAVLVLFIIASMQANQGTRYRYPFSLRLVK